MGRPSDKIEILHNVYGTRTCIRLNNIPGARLSDQMDGKPTSVLPESMDRNIAKQQNSLDFHQKA